MLNERSLGVVKRRRFGAHFQAPCCAERLSFAQLVPSVKGLLTGKWDESCFAADCIGPLQGRYDRVVVILVDALGWNTVERFLGYHPLLRLFETEGVLSLGTSMFPSTTTAHVLYAQTGQLPSASGLYEWRVQIPGHGLVVPLRFSRSGDAERDTLIGELPLDAVFPSTSVCTDLQAIGVSSLLVAPRDVVESRVTAHLARNALHLPYDRTADMIDSVPPVVRSRPGYTYIYLNTVDVVSHKFGPSSHEADTAVCGVLDELHALIGRIRSPDTAIVLVADHGQLDIRPDEMVWLDKLCPLLKQSLKRCRGTGPPLAPGGSIRDLFLHVREDELLRVAAQLRAALAGIAEVWLRDELVSAGIFGRSPPSDRFRDWVGNLVVLPTGSRSVGWSEWHPSAVLDLGFHGGLTAAEMQIPIGLLV